MQIVLYQEYDLLKYSFDIIYAYKYLKKLQSRKVITLKVKPQRISHIEELGFFNKPWNLKFMEPKVQKYPKIRQ